jgi:putative membrane protein
MCEPRRLHPIGILFAFARIARQFAAPTLLAILVSLIARWGDPDVLRRTLVVLLALLAIASLGLAYAVASWARLTYCTCGNELRVERGILLRKLTVLPRERIQSIELRQNVVERLLGLATVKVETAGGREPEVVLSTLTQHDARTLQDWACRAPEMAPAVPLAAADQPAAPLQHASLSRSDLAVAGLTAGRVGVALSALGTLVAMASDLLPWERLSLPTVPLGPSTVLLLLVLVPVLVWGLGLAGTVLAYAGFRLHSDGTRIVIERGLFERKRTVIPIERIQAVSIDEGPLRQPWSLAQLSVEYAGYGTGATESTVLFPLLRRAEVMPFLERFLPAFAGPLAAAEADGLRRPPLRARCRYALRWELLLVVGGLAVLATVLRWPAGAFAVVLLPLAIGLGLAQYRDAGWYVAGDVLVVRWRTLGRHTALVPRRCVQLIEARASLLLRRAGLATVELRVATGSSWRPFRLRHLAEADARYLLDWVRRPRPRAAVESQSAPHREATPHPAT